MNEEMKKLSEAFGQIDKNFKELRAQMGDMSKDNPQQDNMNKIMDMCYQMVSNVHSRIDSLASDNYRWQDNHMQNNTHLPKLTASQHQKLLDSCGAGKDYNIQKPTIYARENGNRGPEFVVDLIKSK